MSRVGRVAGLALALGRAVGRVLPAPARRALDQRFFGAVFQVTRVTNDAYGWRPPPAGPAGPAGPASKADESDATG